MPYNPQISYDFSPITQGAMAAANFMQRGAEAAGQSISQGLTNLGSGVAKGFESAKMTKEELDFLTGTAGSLAQSGALTLEDLERFNKGGLGAKRAIVTQGGMKLNQIYKEDLEKLQHRAKPAFTPTVIPLKDENGKVIGHALTTSPQSAVPFRQGNGSFEPGAQPNVQIDPNTGIPFVQRKSGWVPVNTGATKPDLVLQSQLDNFDRQIAEAQEGLRNGKKHEGFLGNGRPLEQVIADLQRQKEDKIRNAQTSRVAPSGIPMPSGTSAVAAPDTTESPVPIKNREEYNRLPQGSLFVMPDGRIGRKK